MAIVRCPQGHFFDNEKYEGCPSCGEMEEGLSMERRFSIEERCFRAGEHYVEGSGSGSGKHSGAEKHFIDRKAFTEDDVRTVSLESLNAAENIYLSAAEPVKESVRGNWDAEKTVSLSEYSRDNGLLLAGWLVCIEGAMRGKDYRLYSGFNRVGRHISCDICVQDPEVSGENHCAVVYEERAGEFYVVPGKGTLTWLDGVMLQQAEKLPDGSRIRLGGTTLELAAFCKGEHVWKTM